MGGRGSGSGRGGSGTPRGVVAFDIDMDGARAGYVVKNGKVYSENGDSINLSASQIMRNAQNLGYGVKTYNKKQYEKKQEAYRADRKATSNFLNTMDAQMGGNKRAQRKATTSRRGSRRK